MASRTFLRQSTQIRNSDAYVDTNAPGVGMETSPVQIEEDLNNIRSQINRIIREASGNWYDDIPVVNSKKRSLFGLNTGLDLIEEKRILCKADLLTDVVIGASDNFLILSVAGTEAPSQPAAIGAVTTLGTVVAQSAASGPGFAAHELVEVPGPNAIAPKNLVVVRDALNGQVIQSSGRDIFGLLQVENGTADGTAFNDTNQRVKISFVRLTTGLDDLEACPAADIQGLTLNYQYVFRTNLDNFAEDCFLPTQGGFVDNAASIDVTLDRAIDNQAGPATQQQNIAWRIDDSVALSFQDPTGARNLLRLAPAVAGDALELNVDTLDINTTLDADFSEGAIFDSSGVPINIGVTAGRIDAASALTLETTGVSSDLALRASGEVFLDDGNQVGSTWAQTSGIKLSDTTQEWDDFETIFGEASLLSAIAQAKGVLRTKAVAVVNASSISPDTNVTGAGATPNIDAQLADFSSVNFVDEVDIYVNGTLMRNGADATANNDVYPGDTVPNGDLKFEFELRAGDVITMIVWTQ